MWNENLFLNYSKYVIVNHNDIVHKWQNTWKLNDKKEFCENFTDIKWNKISNNIWV